ncbi:MAG: diheme cytochrome c-553 [Bacteroidetes bacterium]|nr:MAG: diheme cytochrome c-553 [Bacteroidota bacterium]
MKFTLFFSLTLSAAFCLTSCTQTPVEKKQESEVSDQAAKIARGKYLVTISGCNDCHSPKRMGPKGPEIIPELMLSGYPGTQPVPAFDSKMLSSGFAMFTPDLTAAAGPWGVSFAGNLTPDETGIGNWTLEQFKVALTQGKYKGLENNRTLLPPMPWVNHIDMTHEDLEAMFSYLKSIPAVKNVVPAPLPPAI